MRLLHLTDTHLGAHLPVEGAPRGWHRSQDHLAAMEQALSPALDGAVDAVIHSGDLFHRSRPGPALRAHASALLARTAARVPVFLIPGNHDRRGLGGSIAAAPGLQVHDEPVCVDLGPFRLGLLPWRPDPARWAAEAAALTARGATLLVAHQGFSGARVPGLLFREGRPADTIGARHLPPDCPPILCGHIHPRQCTPLGGTLVVQPGSTERTSFSEARETKGYALWSLGACPAGWQPVGPHAFRFVDLETRPLALVRDRRALTHLRPRSLVKLALPDETEQDRERVLAAGAWLVRRSAPRPPRPPSRQLRLL